MNFNTYFITLLMVIYNRIYIYIYTYIIIIIIIIIYSTNNI